MKRTWIFFALMLALVGCDAVVEGNLPEDQANRVLVALQAQGIGAVKRADPSSPGGNLYRVEVASTDVARAAAALRAEGLPRRQEPGFDAVFGKGSLVPSAAEERGRYAAALGGELAQSIEAIDGVIEARVHLALPDAREFALDEHPPAPRASVLIKYRRGPAPYAVKKIQALVAGAVEGMKAEDVSVVGVEAAPLPKSARSPLVQVGPFWVSQGSAPLLRGILFTVLGCALALALALVFVLRRRPAHADDNAPQRAGGSS